MADYPIGGEERTPDSVRRLEEAASAYETGGLRSLRVVSPAGPGEQAERSGKVKTSVYLERSDARHLAWLAEVEGRPQAEIVRDAIRQYRWTPPQRHFHIFEAATGEDGPPVPSATGTDGAEELAGFGEDSLGDPRELAILLERARAGDDR